MNRLRPPAVLKPRAASLAITRHTRSVTILRRSDRGGILPSRRRQVTMRDIP